MAENDFDSLARGRMRLENSNLRLEVLTHLQADIYDREGNDEQAYLLLVRHAKYGLLAFHHA